MNLEKKTKAPSTPETYTVAVRFAKDAHLMLIPNVTAHDGYVGTNVAYIVKNDHKIFFSMDQLLYLGRASDLGDE